jgi:hypothetical protein
VRACCAQEKKFRKRVNAEGEVEGVRGSRLSDFLEASLQNERARRRALRREQRAGG